MFSGFRELSTRESRIYLALYYVIIVISFYLNTCASLTILILPVVLTKPIYQLQNTIEPLGLSHWADKLENTRSTNPKAMLRWLFWQMLYHTAHHIFPSVPFWKFHQLNSKIEEQFGTAHKMGWIKLQIAIIRDWRTEMKVNGHETRCGLFQHLMVHLKESLSNRVCNDSSSRSKIQPKFK